MRRSPLALLPLAVLPLVLGLSVPPAAGSSAADQAARRLEAVVETPPRFDDENGGDADADDPAIWVHPVRSADSVVIGTLKNGGLEVYDLGGALLQHIDTPPPPDEGLEAGRFNNVDLLQGVDVGGLPADLVVVTDRGRDRLRVYSVDASGEAAPGGEVLTDVTVSDAPLLFSHSAAGVENETTGYGLALRVTEDGEVWAAVSRRHRTAVGLFHLVPAAGDAVTYEAGGRVQLPSSFELPNDDVWSPCQDPGELPQVEGMVVDSRSDVLYAAQEDVGVWQIPLDGGELGRPRLVEKVREFGVPATYDEETEECVPSGADPGFGGEHLSADAEGLTIAYRPGGTARLVASSQGDSTFSLFRLPSERSRLPWIRTFRVVDTNAVDGVRAATARRW